VRDGASLLTKRRMLPTAVGMPNWSDSWSENADVGEWGLPMEGRPFKSSNGEAGVATVAEEMLAADVVSGLLPRLRLGCSLRLEGREPLLLEGSGELSDDLEAPGVSGLNPASGCCRVISGI